MDITKNKQYEAILNNLLDVKPNDSAILTKVNNKYSFDFYTLFGPEAFDFIYSNKNFNIPILELNLIRICQQLESVEEYEEVIEILEQNNFEISNNKKSWLQKRFSETKNKIIEEIKANFQKQSLKWKLFLNRANEINTETNIWPMHLGFLFVRVNLDGKSIYAPLFFKEVYLEIKNARPFLISNGDIKPNEKLLFLLNNAGFDLEVSDNYGDWTIKELLKHLHKIWGDIYEMNVNLNTKFEDYRAEEITNEALQFEGGVVLGLFQPAGGYVRNRMLEIINNNELNKIIKVEFNKNIYKQRINKTLFNPRTSIFKITPTNFSQDKAIASALNQNTIIWGPPGTGKSQTIVNILTNLLAYGKNSLVCSQKKAALEVIRNRMGELKPFCLFMLNSRNMNKKSFYMPIREYLNYLENFDDVDNLKPLRIIDQQDLKFIENIGDFSEDKRFVEAARVLAKIHNTWESFSDDFWKKIVSLPNDIKYPQAFNFIDSKELTKYMLKINNLRFKIFNPKYLKVKKISKLLFSYFKFFQGDLNEIKKEINVLTADDFGYIKDLVDILPKNKSKDLSDEFELKKFVAKNIIRKINKFNDDEMGEYTEFAATVRLGSLEPYKFIKRFPKMIKKLFPIIIVTPDADLSAWEKEEFDYSILDESSQIFLEKGLPILYLSKIKILAGDDQQMKPTNWFGVRVSDEESIYGKVDSLLDFAKSLGMYSVLLDKNYRSNYASLMTFSSKYFYNGTLDVIDSAKGENNFEAIEVIEANGIWEDNKNVIEANIAIQKCKENLYKYNKIILLCFNTKQQDYITTKIFKYEPILEKAINDGKLLLRNIENIQGDEADLVIASIAYDGNTSIYSTYVGRPGGKNALNVAISRAKDKMIAIKSIKASDLTILTDNEDSLMFKRWLEFLELTNNERKDFLFEQEKDENDYKTDENVQIEPKEKETELEKEIFETLSNVASESSTIIEKNKTIGTIHVDYLISSRSGTPLLCLMVDNYEYKNDASKYIELKDLCDFIRSKKYTVYKLDRITWEAKKDEIISLMRAYEEPAEKDIVEETLEIPTTQLEIMDQIEDKTVVENGYKIEELSLLEENIMLANELKNDEETKEEVIESNENDQNIQEEQTKIIEEHLDETRPVNIDQKTKSPSIDDELTLMLPDDNLLEIEIKVKQPKTKKQTVTKSIKIKKSDDYEIERDLGTIKPFEENTKEWEQILSQETIIDTTTINVE